ncbi:YdcF family protein [Methyloligella sp. 2.7D]|uniref:YdcF family protein n=1 Tax=unclassified Methyloligella TaxID=2625955 RepID=UPI00157CC938|nr:YdcF family protein [Methyloligella sp. GL2]QKP77407.1 YdcF family protein [Methyloligella sp. GL2]
MFFYLAKAVWFLLQPSCFIAFLLLAGTIMVWTYWARWGRRIVALAAGLLLIAGLSPLGNAMVLPLEDRFKRADLEKLPAPTGFIVLGGSESRLVGEARHAPSLNEAGERLVEAAILARQFPDAKIAFSGGDAGIFYPAKSEASGAESLLTALGVSEDRLVLEANSRDTYENAVYLKQELTSLGLAGPDRRWVLITSAYHMPRAMGCFRQAGLDVEAWPVDYRTRGPQDLTRPFDKVSEGLRRVDMASREWVGLFAYWLTGRTDALFPAPAATS